MYAIVQLTQLTQFETKLCTMFKKEVGWVAGSLLCHLNIGYKFYSLIVRVKYAY